MKRKSTIKDLAEYAEVSVATVSRVIHRNGYVSKENSEKVKKAIEELQYEVKAPLLPKALDCKLIAVISSPALEHTFLPRLNYALYIAANTAGYFTLNIARQLNNQNIPGILADVLAENVCGIVFTDFQEELTSANKQLLMNCGVPVVLIERGLCAELNGVRIDTKTGVYQSTNHLLEAGRRNIYYLSAPLAGEVERDRLLGFRLAHFEAHIPLNENQIRICKTMHRSSCTEMLENIYQSGERPDGFVTWSDLFAITTLQYLNKNHIRVPEDVLLIGYDDFLASYTSPMLSSIHSPIDEMSAAAIDIIKNAQNRNGEIFARTIQLTPKLVIRETT